MTDLPEPVMHKTMWGDLFTATQLAQARQQGAEKERQENWKFKCEAISTAQEHLQRIADLEKSNAQLLEALQDLKRQYSEHPDAFWDWTKARAAIAEVKP